jgi:prevent-host-death family protein
MAKPRNIHRAKTDPSGLIAEVEAGGEVIIAQVGKPLARLMLARLMLARLGPVKKERKRRRDRLAGFHQDEIWIGPDVDASLPEEILQWRRM